MTVVSVAGGQLTAGLVWTVIVIVLGVFGKDLGQVSLVEDQYPVAHLTAERSDHPLADRIRPWCLWRVLMIRRPCAVPKRAYLC
jgi:hypothetical protein